MDAYDPGHLRPVDYRTLGRLGDAEVVDASALRFRREFSELGRRPAPAGRAPVAAGRTVPACRSGSTAVPREAATSSLPWDEPPSSSDCSGRCRTRPRSPSRSRSASRGFRSASRSPATPRPCGASKSSRPRSCPAARGRTSMCTPSSRSAATPAPTSFTPTPTPIRRVASTGPGTRVADSVHVAPGGAATILLTLHVGPAGADITLRAGDRDLMLPMAHDETRQVAIPVPARRCTGADRGAGLARLPSR